MTFMFNFDMDHYGLLYHVWIQIAAWYNIAEIKSIS